MNNLDTIRQAVHELVATDMKSEMPRGIDLMRDIFAQVLDAYMSFDTGDIANGKAMKKIVLFDVMPDVFTTTAVLIAQKKGL